MSSNKPSRILRFTRHALRFTCFFIFGLAICRIVYEWAFPQLLWLARPFPTLLLATLIASTSLTLSPFHPLTPSTSLRASFSPLLLNLLYLFNPAVNLIESRLIFFASVWLTAVLISHHRLRPTPWFGPIFILLGLLPIYLLTMPHTVGRADTFEFQVVAPQLGIAHPTGYPLYLLVSKLFTLIPISSVAWRINFGSAVFALSALIILYRLILRLTSQPLPALLGAIAIGLTPTFWSQAIEAEVYTLHALIVAVALWFILEIGRLEFGDWRLVLMLAFVLGLGLTNHLTTVFLAPAAILATLFALHKYGSLRDAYRLLITDYRLLPKLLLAALLPLTLYAYLPLRWAAVNKDAMGFGRFVDWVIGGRFQDALQWSAWYTDPTRYQVLGRIFLNNWGAINLVIAAIGLIYLFRQQGRTAVLLLLTWLSFSFYALNYYIPDISVFVIPAHIIIGIWWACGVMGLWGIGYWLVGKLEIGDWRLKRTNLQSPISTLLLLPLLLPTITHWPQIDRSADEALTLWGTAVLAQPLAANAAILADSEKIAPLYYLQQAEGVRPDLDIMVLPDEAAYRAELDGRLPQQTIYLARFLPGLEGIYHLRSAGPLTEVSSEPMSQLPDQAIAQPVDVGGIELLGYALEDVYEREKTAVTLYWRTDEPINQQLHIYLRWQESQTSKPGQHPANNSYPTNAWRVGEIVPDFHLLPNPSSSQPQAYTLQAAFAPLFTPPPQLDWHTVALLDVPATEVVAGLRPLRIQINNATLTGIQHNPTVRPQTPLALTTTGFGRADSLTYQLSVVSNQLSVSSNQLSVTSNQSPVSSLQSPFIHQIELDTDVDNGRYPLIVHAEYGAICGWLQPTTTSCTLGYVNISGVPLPANATNYDDKIALLEVALDTTELQAGGQLPLTLHWQSLAAMTQDYTIFIQVLDTQDRIVGQIDAWPLQGTLPTSQWPPGETIRDPHLIQLSSDLPAGNYRLIIGWYLLADFGRLPVLDKTGAPIADKHVVPGLIAP